jgi:hypothetical protein
MGMHGFGVFVIGEVGCELLVLLEACITLMRFLLTEIIYVFDYVLPPVASLSGVRL